jgi:ketosteroid isomerase-like protein
MRLVRRSVTTIARQRTVAPLSNSESSFGRTNVNTRSMIWGLLSGVMMLSGAATAAAADSAEQAVAAAEHQWMKAQQTNNVESIAALLADKYVSTDQDGTVIVGKDANVADARSTTYSSMDYADLKVTAFGNTAIATGTFAGKGTHAGKPFDLRGRFTDTWVMSNGKWLCVADHVSLIKK